MSVVDYSVLIDIQLIFGAFILFLPCCQGLSALFSPIYILKPILMWTQSELLPYGLQWEL